MMAIICFVTIGIVLLAMELVLPGGLLGVLAAMLFLAATVATFIEYGALAAILLFMVSIAVTVLVFLLEVKLLRNSPLTKYIVHTHTNNAVSNTTYEPELLVGKPGTTLTKLTPSGRVLVGGKTYEAASLDDQLPADLPVEVVRLDSFRLIVKPAGSEVSA